MSTILPLLFFSGDTTPTPSDPFWNDVVLLMPLNSSTGYSCLKGRTTSPGTTLSIQTVGGFECSNTWGYVNHDSLFNLGSSDFTLECYARFLDLNTRSTIFQLSNQESNGEQPYLGFFMFPFSTFYFEFVQPVGGYVFMSTPPIFATNTWYHVAATREGSSWKLWVNGNLQRTITDTRTILANNNLSIKILHGGRWNQNPPVFPFDGYVHSIRLTRACRYTANFTPPSIPFPSS